jgi:hypothetical protein
VLRAETNAALFLGFLGGGGRAVALGCGAIAYDYGVALTLHHAHERLIVRLGFLDDKVVADLAFKVNLHRDGIGYLHDLDLLLADLDDVTHFQLVRLRQHTLAPGYLDP